LGEHILSVREMLNTASKLKKSLDWNWLRFLTTVRISIGEQSAPHEFLPKMCANHQQRPYNFLKLSAVTIFIPRLKQTFNDFNNKSFLSQHSIFIFPIQAAKGFSNYTVSKSWQLSLVFPRTRNLL
jgi:hypothetical protein